MADVAPQVERLIVILRIGGVRPLSPVKHPPKKKKRGEVFIEIYVGKKKNGGEGGALTPRPRKPNPRPHPVELRPPLSF